LQIYQQDLIVQNLIGKGVNNLISSVRKHKAFVMLAECHWKQDVAFGLNLIWPTKNKISIPKSQQIILSFHTEQLDHWFIKTVCNENPASDIIVLYDGHVYPSAWWPKNVRFFRYITWHTQLENIIEIWGKPKKRTTKPKHSLSALSFRCTQIKTYVIGLLSSHANKDNFIMSWHVLPEHSTDTHAWNGTGRKKLDTLADKMLSMAEIRADDWYGLAHNRPMQNSDCKHPAYQDCAFNITNESFHYSFSLMDGVEFIYPGPYFTEKTWKPLLAGNGIICAGQWQSYISLEELGLHFDYGIDFLYDDIKEDLDRMCALLDVIDFVADIDVDQLEEMSKDSVLYNQDHILSGRLSEICQAKNKNYLEEFFK
jgi:hypothetical protein